MVTTKKCGHCKNVFNHSNFHKCKSRGDGLSSWCKTCDAKKAKEYRKKPGYMDKSSKRSKNWLNNNPDKAKIIRRRSYIKWKYGIGLEELDRLHKKQSGLCAICGSKDPGPPGFCLHVDHNHTTGEVRGLLCSSCNFGIGNFGDSVSNLLCAIEYLKQYGG